MLGKMNHINEIREALYEVASNQQYLQEGALADKMRAMNKKTKERWDKDSDKKKDAAYKALDKAKKTQNELEKSDFINNIKEEDYVSYIAQRLRYHLKGC